MDNSDTAIHVVTPTKPDEFLDFWTWLSTATTLKLKLIGFAGLVVPTLAIAYYTTGIVHNLSIHIPFAPPSAEQAVQFSYGAQIAVVFLVLVFHAFFVEPKKVKDCEFGNAGGDRIWFWWSMALVSFLLLYITLWVRTTQTDGPLGSLVGVLGNLSNNLSTVAFLMCFAAMETPEKAGGGTNRKWVLLWTACLLMVTFVESVFRFKYPDVVSHWRTDWFGLLTGASAGVALAMFCGRLCSPLINLNISAVVPLNLYAVVQISFGFWVQQKGVALIMANACLILKCFLALVIAWLLTTRHMIFYMETVNTIRSELEMRRNQFRECPIALVKGAPRDSA